MQRARKTCSKCTWPRLARLQAATPIGTCRETMTSRMRTKNKMIMSRTMTSRMRTKNMTIMSRTMSRTMMMVQASEGTGMGG
jgi:hypothetical protein